MRVLAVFALAFVALTAAERDWSKITNMDLKVAPVNGHRFPHKPSTRITGGNEAVPHSRPWQVGLFIPKSATTVFCGGSLIDAQTVLTAARCVYNAFDDIEVVLGAHNIREEEATQVSVYSSHYFNHDQYDPYNLLNDVGLIKLPSPVTFNENIQPLPIDTSSCSDDYVGQEANVSGWGVVTDSSFSRSPVLREVTLPVIDSDECDIYYFSTIPPTQICVGTAGRKSPCDGDSGGPLVLNGSQIGIVSFGSSYGCEVEWPVVFTRVCQFSSWIERHKQQ